MEIKELSINDHMNLAKRGDAASLKLMHDRYTYIADKFYNDYKKYITKDEIYCIYDKLFSKYFTIDYGFSISAYIHHGYERAIKHYLPKKVLLSEHINNAINGDKKAREEIINYYSKIVFEKAREYDYLEYDELVQYGIIKLIEMIDLNLKYRTTGCWAGNLVRGIDIYFGNTLRNQVLNYNNQRENYDYHSFKQMNEIVLEQEYISSMSKIEIDDLIKSTNLTKKQKMYALKYFVEGLSINGISCECGCSKQVVFELVGYATKRLENNYKSR